jgi:SynChlorMet cassette protein ScmC
MKFLNKYLENGGIHHKPGDMTPAIILRDGSKWVLAGSRHKNDIVNELALIMGVRKNPSLAISPLGNETLTGNNQNSKAGNGHTPTGPIFHDRTHSQEPNAAQDFITSIDAKKLKAILNVLLAIYRQSIDRGGLPCHSGLAELDGSGILLSAPSGTGKTTCCKRLPEYWRPLCDDETLLVLDKKDQYQAHPFPTWSDYLWKRAQTTWDVQHSVPLAGVFFLRQAAVDGVAPLGQGKAAMMLYESANQVCYKFSEILTGKELKQLRCNLFNNACAIAKKISAYRLEVSLHGRFWIKIEQTLNRELTEIENA